MFILSYKYNKYKDESEAVALVSTISLLVSLGINLIINSNKPELVPLMFMISIIYFIASTNNDCYKVISYVVFNIFIFKLFEGCNLIFYPLISCVLTLLLTLLNTVYEKTKIENYLIIQYIFSYIMISLFELSIYSLFGLFALIACSYLVLKNKTLQNIAIFTLIPVLYLKTSFLSEYLCFLSVMVIMLLTLFANEKKGINIFTIAAFIYYVLHISSFENTYLNILLIMLITFAHIFTNTGKKKDLFKFGFYLSTFALAVNLISDYIKIYDFIMGSIIAIVFLLVSTRTIFNKYTRDYKMIEYVFLILINLFAIGSVNNETEGYLLLFMFVLCIMIGYIYKFGPLFLISLISVIYSAFLLTEEFWLNISWWIYILGLGIILVAFAINNEAKGKKVNSKEKWEEIKQKYDL